ncbi:type II secretion system F family protein [Lentilitoribacter sp. Alg239-R112]|uniref:type II secretion system F family protein n=1 Tax=Lentilitoribacter sp. Alg239-R112 TaxID=2305987 RepID=UPI0013A70034|nr:type II secretion system F family protein [Lentilitoribacter sp. Alg239-R112]
MFGLDIKLVMLVALVAVAVGAAIYAFFFNTIDAQRHADTRISRMSSGSNSNNYAQKKAANDRIAEMSKRKKSVQESLKELEDKQNSKKKKTASLKDKLAQAGLTVSIEKFYVLSLALGLFCGVVTYFLSQNPLVSMGVLFVSAAGVPLWIVSFLRKRRFKAFLEELPNSLDVMVRSIKSGLPLNDAIRLISSEAAEPVKSEFLKIVEAQQVGMSVPEACSRMYERIPVPEVNFFAVVINIQAQAGGNLSEALDNLSSVLRARKTMKAKVKAMSMEAKASAVIIGALPFIVGFLVFLSSRDYIMILFTDQRGHLIMGVSLVWMTIGVLVMRKMIDFEV